jgi:hypothetical protein
LEHAKPLATKRPKKRCGKKKSPKKVDKGLPDKIGEVLRRWIATKYET